jgi:hypothetical protein
MMMYSTVNLLALAALLILFLVSLRWVFGESKPKKVRHADVVRGTQRADGTWDRSGSRGGDR